MAKQHPMTRYAYHAINNAKIQKPPRHPKREINLYIYQTNQTLRVIEETDKSISLNVKCKHVQTLKLNPTFLPLELSTPRFENPADTGHWLTQIKGFIYKKLKVDPKYYYFFILKERDEEITNIQPVAKFRIVRNSELVSGKEFIYSEILAVTESKKSFPAIDKVDWEIVEELKIYDKVKKIKIEIEHNAQFFPNGIQLFTKKNLIDAKATRNLITNVSDMKDEDRCINHINILGVNPILTNYTSWQYLLDKRWRQSSGIDNAIFGISYGFSSKKPITKITNYSFSFKKNNPTEWDWWREEVFSLPPTIEYFTSNWTTKNTLNNQDNIIAKEMSWNQSLDFIRDFLNNQAYFKDKRIPELDEKWKPNTEIIKLEDRNLEKPEDRKYFVLGKNLELQKIFSIIDNVHAVFHAAIVWKSTNYQFNRLNTSQWKELIGKEDIKLTIDLERAEFSPRIKLGQKEATWVKFTLYNETNEEITTTTFLTNNYFHDGDLWSVFQF